VHMHCHVSFIRRAPPSGRRGAVDHLRQHFRRPWSQRRGRNGMISNMSASVYARERRCRATAGRDPEPARAGRRTSHRDGQEPHIFKLFAYSWKRDGDSGRVCARVCEICRSYQTILWKPNPTYANMSALPCSR
jgi:hypothetical protein